MSIPISEVIEMIQLPVHRDPRSGWQLVIRRN